MGDGARYGDGPVHLTGKKMLPVLEGPGVPCATGAAGMPESRGARGAVSSSAATAGFG